MSLRLGDIAPDFTAVTTEGTINFHQWLGSSWGFCFRTRQTSLPYARPNSEWSRKSKPNLRSATSSLLMLSAWIRSNPTSGWIKDINETQSCTMNFPVIADQDRKVATAYDMIHPNADDKATVRSVFVIGPDKKVKLDADLSRQHRAQFSGNPAGHRFASIDFQSQGRHPGDIGTRARIASCRPRFLMPMPKKCFPKASAR